jgi:hypothetical protein
MTPGALTGALLLLPIAALALLAAPPREAWRAGAEHSRWFWSAWVVTAVMVGLAGWARFGGAGGTAWLALWCAVGSAQPSMIADLVDVRRQRDRRASRSRPAVVVGAGPRPIQWQAPAPVDAARVPQAHAG